MLPDGSCSQVALRPGASIRDVLQELCCNISVNMAAVDLFLVGGEKVSTTGCFSGFEGGRDKNLLIAQYITSRYVIWKKTTTIWKKQSLIQYYKEHQIYIYIKK